MYQMLNRRWGRSGNDSYTKLLLHCNGDDASTTFRDDSRSDHTVIANGNAQLDTAQKKFEKSSGLFGDTSYLSIADSDDWNFGSGNLTIDFWVRFADISADRAFFSQYQDANNYFNLYWVQSVNQLWLVVRESASNIIFLMKAWSPSIDTWYHVALIRGWGGNANDWAFTINGTQIGTTTTDASAWPNYTGNCRIGSSESISMGHNGWFDEFRVSKGIGRETANFIPKSGPYR